MNSIRAKDFPEIIVTPWQSAFDGGWRVPAMCILPYMDSAYWWSQMRDWDNDRDWNMDERSLH